MGTFVGTETAKNVSKKTPQKTFENSKGFCCLCCNQTNIGLNLYWLYSTEI